MISFKAILGVLLGMLVMSIVGWSIISYHNSEASVQTAEQVRHTHEVLECTDEVSSLYKDIQLESNSFFVSRDSALLQPYLNARKEIVPLIEHLRKLTLDSSTQKYRVDTLRSYIKQLIVFTSSGLQKSGRSFTPEELNQRLKTSFQSRQQIRKIIERIKAEELRILVLRERAHESSVIAFNRTFFLLIGGILILLATAFFSIRYNFNRRIKAQEDQRRATELFTKIFYESPMGIVISALETGRIIDCNNAYTELIKFSKTELIGKNGVELGIIDSVNQHNEIVNQVRTNGVIRDREVQLRPKNSDPIWVSKSMQLIKIDNEDCILSALLDLTVHKEAEEKTKRALESEFELSKLKSNFVTLASHEFRTPLTTILSSAFLLENYVFGEKEKAGRHIDRIKGSVKMLTSILDEFLSVTEIEEGKVMPKRQRINLKHTMESLFGDLRTFARPGQRLIYEHFGDEEVETDPVLLGNIVNNLVSNAIKYSQDNDEIYVTTAVNGKIYLVVKDHGIGISKEDQQHLFERFFRASNAGNAQGTGLGLHIMKHYVDLLNGSVQVESEPGKGSEFSITFDPSSL